jgi:hypothetical protein
MDSGARQKKGFVKDHIIDENLYREALAFSLNHDDTNPPALAPEDGVPVPGSD